MTETPTYAWFVTCTSLACSRRFFPCWFRGSLAVFSTRGSCVIYGFQCSTKSRSQDGFSKSLSLYTDAGFSWELKMILLTVANLLAAKTSSRKLRSTCSWFTACLEVLDSNQNQFWPIFVMFDCILVYYPNYIFSYQFRTHLSEWIKSS